VTARDHGCLLALDQGTTSTRAMAFDMSGREIARHQIPLKQFFPESGWVEHDAEEIWQAALACLNAVIDTLKGKGITPLALGITNQRETTVLWQRKTGTPVHRAIVWQDRRTAKACQALKEKGAEGLVSGKTGLLLDPYFSATKLAWILEQNPDLQARAADLAFGTIESYLLFRLTGVHATDATNASRTMLYNIHDGAWDPELLNIFDIPKVIFPEVVDNAFTPIPVHKDLLRRPLAVSAMIGDQQAAAVGQGCITAGAIKSTFGTGAFMLQNTGREAPKSANKLLTTVATQLDGQRTFALEGSIFIAGAVIQWLRDGLKFIDAAEQSEGIAAKMAGNDGVYLIPAFTGLGAPHWDPDARGAVVGLTRDSGPSHFIRAGLESVAYQTHDLLQAFVADSGTRPDILRVDGGMVANGWFLQFLSDILNLPVERPVVAETTALGAAFLAGLGAGVYKNLSEIKTFWHLDKAFVPAMNGAVRDDLLKGWEEAISRIKTRR